MQFTFEYPLITCASYKNRYKKVWFPLIMHNLKNLRSMVWSICLILWIIINYFASTIPQVTWSKCHTHEDQFMDIFDNIDIMEQQCEVLISKIVFLTSKNLILCAKSQHYPYINYTTPWRSLILHTLAWHLKVLVELPLSQDFWSMEWVGCNCWRMACIVPATCQWNY